MTAADRLREQLQAGGPRTTRPGRADRRLLISLGLQKISGSGQLVLPVAVRRTFGIEHGGFVEFLVPPKEREFSKQISVIRRKGLSNTSAYVTPGGNWASYKVAANGQLTLPAALRSQWSLGRSGEIEMAAFEDKVIIAQKGGTDHLAAEWIGTLGDEPEVVTLDRPGSTATIIPGALLGVLLCGNIPTSKRSLIVIASEADMATRELVAHTSERPVPSALEHLTGIGVGIGRWEWQNLILSLSRPARVHPDIDLRIEAAGIDAVIRSMRFVEKHRASVDDDDRAVAILHQGAFAMAVADELDAALLLPDSWLSVLPASAFGQFGLTAPATAAVAGVTRRKPTVREMAAFLLDPTPRKLQINDELIVELGLGDLPVKDRKALMRTFYETLEQRVGQVLAGQMTEEQLDEFEAFFDAKDDAGAFGWLEENFPDYREIVAAQYDAMKQDVMSQAPAIRAAAAE